MFKSVIGKKGVQQKMLTILVAVAAAVMLPQLFHLLGLASGLGASLGATFLPMHMPVLMAGMLAGPFAGLVAGIISPLLSYFLTGMPIVDMLPFMLIELASYGLIAGLLFRAETPSILKLLIAQAGGRAMRAVAVIAAIYCFGAQGLTLQNIWSVILTGLPGIALQLAIIPLLIYRVKGFKGRNV